LVGKSAVRHLLMKVALSLAPIPRQQLDQTVCGMLGDVRQHVTQPCLGINIVHAAGGDQVVHDGGAITAGIGTAKHAAFSYTSYPSERPLGGIVGEADSAVVQKKSEAVPEASHVIDRLGDLIVFRKLGPRVAKPGLQALDERSCPFLSERPIFHGRFCRWSGVR